MSFYARIKGTYFTIIQQDYKNPNHHRFADTSELGENTDLQQLANIWQVVILTEKSVRLSEDKHLVVPHQRIHSRQPVGTGLRHSGGGDNV